MIKCARWCWVCKKYFSLFWPYFFPLRKSEPRSGCAWRVLSVHFLLSKVTSTNTWSGSLLCRRLLILLRGYGETPQHLHHRILLAHWLISWSATYITFVAVAFLLPVCYFLPIYVDFPQKSFCDIIGYVNYRSIVHRKSCCHNQSRRYCFLCYSGTHFYPSSFCFLSASEPIALLHVTR